MRHAYFEIEGARCRGLVQCTSRCLSIYLLLQSLLSVSDLVEAASPEGIQVKSDLACGISEKRRVCFHCRSYPSPPSPREFDKAPEMFSEAVAKLAGHRNVL